MSRKSVRLKVTVYEEEHEWLTRIAECEAETVDQIVRRWIRTAARQWGLNPNYPTADGNRRGPTEKTRIRAEVFKGIKTAHPSWGYDRVAIEASRDLAESVSAETVRNAYRLMGWKWPRADRIR